MDRQTSNAYLIWRSWRSASFRRSETSVGIIQPTEPREACTKQCVMVCVCVCALPWGDVRQGLFTLLIVIAQVHTVFQTDSKVCFFLQLYQRTCLLNSLWLLAVFPSPIVALSLLVYIFVVCRSKCPAQKFSTNSANLAS